MELPYSFSIAKGQILVIPEHFQFPFNSEQISHIQHALSARVAWELPWKTVSRFTVWQLLTKSNSLMARKIL